MTQPNIKVFDAFDAFLLAKRAKNVVENTRYLYQWTMAFWHQRWGDLHLAEVTPGHVRSWLLWMQGQEQGEGAPPRALTADGQPLSSSSVYTAFRNLRTFWRWCELEELIVRSPMRNVEAPMVEEVIPDCLTEDEADSLLESVRRNGDRNAFRDYVIHFFFLATGVRLAELAGLSVTDVDLKAGYAKVFGKRRRERIVSLGVVLPLEIKRYLLKWRDPAEGEKALFLNEQGRRLGTRGVQELVIRDLKRYIGRPLNRIGPHTYRHTFVTLRLRQTRDLKGTSIAAGHTDTRTTERYTHLALRDVLHGQDGKPYSPMDMIVRRRSTKDRKGDSLRGGYPKPAPPVVS